MIAILENADDVAIANFMEDENGNRLIFSSYEEADYYLDNNGTNIVYRFIGDNEDY